MYEETFFFLIGYLLNFIMIVVCLLLTCCSDPGIIPRKPILELKDDYPRYYLDE